MTREQLEHLIRAAAVIAADDSIVVIGSQAILGQFRIDLDSLQTAQEDLRLGHPVFRGLVQEVDVRDPDLVKREAHKAASTGFRHCGIPRRAAGPSRA